MIASKLQRVETRGAVVKRESCGPSTSRHPRGQARLCAFAASSVDEPSVSSRSSHRDAKAKLLQAIRDTGRGFRASRFLRGVIEEAQVNVEAFATPELDYNLLEGKWKLLYTTASDVLPILESEARLRGPIGPSPVQVGNIYQQFSNIDEQGVGSVFNIIQLSTPFLLEERNGVTLTVQARYEVRSPHRIALTFEEARVGDVRISEGLQALLAPALLPRGSLQHMVLLAIKQFQLRFPFRSAQQLATEVSGNNSAISAGGNYQLTYLDEDMLIGRATALGGTFIFERELP